ncbi:type II toxin-antitoxin system VapC family toxin [Granulicella sp. S190]|uniref:type II toxin-antitoxin system VapC family toxin n=1 Tax=Granulicella sp. S190 TaxID=1747226 RepID=UPI00131AFD79|nr:type II toxin-antitoxin system VapC family toxin [Granulicella sp. S190]
MNELFDTNILIDHLNGVSKATREIQRQNPSISTITWIEVMTGAKTQSEEVILRAFLVNFQVLAITSAVAEQAALNRRQKRIKMPDAIILATAEIAGRILVTRNVKDFPAGTRGVRVPYKI